jgi:hypothetical protein
MKFVYGWSGPLPLVEYVGGPIAGWQYCFAPRQFEVEERRYGFYVYLDGKFEWVFRNMALAKPRKKPRKKKQQ